MSHLFLTQPRLVIVNCKTLNVLIFRPGCSDTTALSLTPLFVENREVSLINRNAVLESLVWNANRRNHTVIITLFMSQVHLVEHRGFTNWGDRKSNQIKCRFLLRGENRSTPGKPLGAEWRTNKPNPQMTSDPGIEPGPYWWKASVLTTAPTLLPKKS